MAELKTKPTDQGVGAFLNSIPDEQKRRDAFTRVDIMRKATKVEPQMWGSNIVGFGTYHYKGASGRRKLILGGFFAAQAESDAVHHGRLRAARRTVEVAGQVQYWQGVPLRQHIGRPRSACAAENNQAVGAVYDQDAQEIRPFCGCAQWSSGCVMNSHVRPCAIIIRKASKIDSTCSGFNPNGSVNSGAAPKINTSRYSTITIQR